MKKLIILLLSLGLMTTSCENEPVDGALIGETGDNNGGGNDDGGGNNNGGGNDDGGGSQSPDLELDSYELDVDLNISFFGIPINTVTNSDINISNDIITSSTVDLTTNGVPSETENQTYTRNNAGQIVSNVSVTTSGITTNEYIISYQNGNISQITYDYFEDDIDDYTYNFTYSDNIITREVVGSTISSVFTLDNTGRVIKKESFDDGFPIQTETVTYNIDGNIANSLTSGEISNNVTYTFDNKVNPLQIVYGDNYLLNFLADEYGDEIGPAIAQYHCTNNWTGANFNGDNFMFDITYNSQNRISTRDINFNLGAEFSVSMNEVFNYVN